MIINSKWTMKLLYIGWNMCQKFLKMAITRWFLARTLLSNFKFTMRAWGSEDDIAWGCDT